MEKLHPPIRILAIGVICGLCGLGAPLLSAQDSAESGEPATASESSTEPVPLFDPKAPLPPVEPADPATGGTNGEGLVPLFDPGGGAGESAPYEDSTTDEAALDGATDSDLVPLFDPSGGGAFEDELAGRDWDAPPSDDPEVFDLEAARRMLDSEMAPPGDLVPVESAMDVVESAADLDRELGETALRGRDELGLDLRSVERFRWQCGNEMGRRDVTLFGNGTVRLRRGPDSERAMQLAELDEEKLLGYLSRLARIQRSRELNHDVAGGEDFGQIDGELGERCTISLKLPDLPAVFLTMPRLEVPQLGLAQLVEIADRLARSTRPLVAPRRVRADYVPQPGDHLLRKDGRYFRVVGPTTDGDGVELEGLQEPVRIFYRVADLPLLFEPAEGAIDPAPVEVQEPEVRDIAPLGGS